MHGCAATTPRVALFDRHLVAHAPDRRTAEQWLSGHAYERYAIARGWLTLSPEELARRAAEKERQRAARAGRRQLLAAMDAAIQRGLEEGRSGRS